MQIEEIKELKAKLENDIVKLITEFHNVSPIGIKSVNVKTESYYTDSGCLPVTRISNANVVLDWESI